MKKKISFTLYGICLLAAVTSIPHAFAGDLSAKGKVRANNAAKVLTLMTKDPLKDPKNEKVMQEMDDDDSDKPDLKPSHVALALKWVDASFPSTILLSSTCMAGFLVKKPSLQVSVEVTERVS